MTIIYIGILLFGGAHLFSILLPAVRNRMKAWLGERRYMGLYALVSGLGVVMLAIGYWQTRYSGSFFYIAQPGTRHVTMLLVLIGFILMAAANGKGYIRKWLQNPFSIGVALWATGHLIANGKTVVVLIYACLLTIAVADILANMLRGNRPLYQPQFESDMIAVILGTVLYGVVLFGFHPYVLGVPVLR